MRGRVLGVQQQADGAHIAPDQLVAPGEHPREQGIVEVSRIDQAAPEPDLFRRGDHHVLVAPVQRDDPDLRLLL